MTTAADLRVQLDLLVAERFAAVEHGLDHDGVYMDDLEADLAEALKAFVGLAVTEIATFRAELGGPLLG